MRKTRLLILFGGRSTEHEVSRMSAAAVVRNADPKKYALLTVGITQNGKWQLTDSTPQAIESGEWEHNPENLPAHLSPDAADRGLFVVKKDKTAELLPVDVVFPVLHGLYGEDGTVQGLCRLADLPCVGPGVAASANCMDKVITKILLRQAGVPQVRWDWLRFADYLDSPQEYIAHFEKHFTYPLFVKPANSGSSLGMTKVKSRAGFDAAIRLAGRHDGKILIEDCAVGQEIEVAVLGNRRPQASGCGEIVPCNEYYDYDAKYIDDRSELIVPARLPEAVAEEVREMALAAYTALDCVGLARVDFFVEKDGKVLLNELNTLPGFTKISMYPRLWEREGLGFSELIDRLVQLARES